MPPIVGGRRNLFFPQDNSKSLISIVIVTYNAETFIQNCIDSIAQQRYKNLEVLIFDGASTDKTIEIIMANEQHISYWQSEPDNGIYEAMNKAVKYATGHWYYFLGVDDMLLPTFSEMAEKLMQQNTIYSGDCVTDKGEKLDGDFPPYRLTKMNVSHQAVFYPAAVFSKYAYQLKFRVYADYVLNIQCWGDTSFPKKYLPILIACYHSGGFSSFVKDEIFEQERDGLIRKYLSIPVYLRYLIKKWKKNKKKK